MRKEPYLISNTCKNRTKIYSASEDYIHLSSQSHLSFRVMIAISQFHFTFSSVPYSIYSIVLDNFNNSDTSDGFHVHITYTHLFWVSEFIWKLHFKTFSIHFIINFFLYFATQIFARTRAHNFPQTILFLIIILGYE